MNPQLIVCVVDLTSEDRPVLAQAVRLARWYGAELHVVHVGPRRRSNRAGSAIARRLTDLIESLDADGVAITPVSMSGDPIKEAAGYAGRMFADLFVVGQRAHKSRRYWSAGAFAGALSRAVACPILMVPVGGDPKASGPQFRNIVCGIDFSFAALGALDKALDVAQASGGTLTLVNVLTGFAYDSVYSGGEAMRLVDGYRAWARTAAARLHALVPPDVRYWCEVNAEAVSGTAHGAILRTASQRGADLIVIGSPRRPVFERIVMRSAVRGVLRDAQVPVLTVPGPTGLADDRPAPAARPDGERAWPDGSDRVSLRQMITR